MNDTNNGMNLVLTFCGGVAVGATAALLLAPKSGREVRGDIASYAKAGVDKTAQIPEAVKHASGAMKNAVSQAITNGTRS